MKPVRFIVLFVALFLFVPAAASAGELRRSAEVFTVSLDDSLRVRQADLLVKMSPELRKLKRIIRAQWCEFECSYWCMVQDDECNYWCQFYGGNVYECDAQCEVQMRACMCQNQCCHEPYAPGEDYCS